MTEPKITSGLKKRLMTSVAVYRRRPAAEATDRPMKRAAQSTLDRENVMPRKVRPPHDDVQ